MPMRVITIILCLTVLSINTVTKIRAAPTENVVTSIKPIDSLVQAVIGNTGTTDIIIDGTTSPHEFTLKPSQAQKIYQARIIFYIDETFEAGLAKVIDNLPESIKTIPLAQQNGLTLLPYRESRVREMKNDNHDHADDHDHEQEKHHGEDRHHEEHAHHHGDNDPHLWLDPKNAQKITAYIAETLSEIYPENQAIYAENARQLIDTLNQLDSELKTDLEKIRNKPFVVFHDAYQYFENAYQLNGVGAILRNPEIPPTPADIREIREILRETGAQCVFAEPQFPTKIAQVVIENTNAKTAILDPLGADLPKGENLYFTMLRNLARNLINCLQK